MTILFFISNKGNNCTCKNGMILEDNMRKEKLTEDELKSKLRELGLKT